MDLDPAQRAAHDDLRFIRRTLEAAGRFSLVPGRGLVLIGCLALLAAAWDRRLAAASLGAGGRTCPALPVWGALLAASLVTGIGALKGKARRISQPAFPPILRRALWGYGAAMALGGILTLAAWRAGRPDLLPVVWLGCYGAALTAAGALSITAVRVVGIAFLATAAVAALAPPAAGPALLAAGFGGLHIAFGAYVAWRHDG
jgi:hypothetical protein